MHRAGIKKQAGDTLSGLEPSGTSSTNLDGDLPEMMLPLIEHRRENIGDNHDGNTNL